MKVYNLKSNSPISGTPWASYAADKDLNEAILTHATRQHVKTVAQHELVETKCTQS